MTRRVEGTSRIYQLADPTVLAGYHALVAVAQARIAEVSALADASFGPVVGARAVTLDEFEAVAGDPHVVLVDVRPASEFAAGHVAGAVTIPVSELATRMGVTTAVEHPATTAAPGPLAAGGWSIHTLPVDTAGRADPAAMPDGPIGLATVPPRASARSTSAAAPTPPRPR